MEGPHSIKSTGSTTSGRVSVVVDDSLGATSTSSVVLSPLLSPPPSRSPLPAGCLAASGEGFDWLVGGVK